MSNRDFFEPAESDLNRLNTGESPAGEPYLPEIPESNQTGSLPPLGDVEQILREIHQEELPELPAGPMPQEFRDQEYRDAFDEGFEQAFSEGEGGAPEPEAPPRPRKRRGRPRRKAIKKKGSGLLGIPHFISTLILWALVLVISVTLARILWLWADDVLALTKEERTASVTISDSDTMSQIAEKLASAGLVRYPKLFEVYCSVTDAREKISAGEFTLNGMYDYHAMINAMSGYSSDRKEVEVMIPEGYECRQIFELLERNEVCTVEELETAAMSGDLGDYWFLEDVERDGPYCLEGFLFPDTYNFYTSDDPERVLRKLLRNFDYRFSDDMVDDIKDLNTWYGEKLAAYGYDEDYIRSQYLTIRDVVNIAAMIERETAGSGESATIASVIYNRLASPDYPYLNIDATIQYALGERKANLTYDDLEIDSPYNTYRNPGLPIGPISNPGLNSLNAALHPQDTDYFWYALDTDGTHHFSQTQAEHEAFLASLQEDEDEG